jgi:hypothetical protein
MRAEQANDRADMAVLLAIVQSLDASVQGLTNEVRIARPDRTFRQSPTPDRGGSRLSEARDRLGLDRDRPHPRLARDRRRGHQIGDLLGRQVDAVQAPPPAGATRPRWRRRRNRSLVVDSRASIADAISAIRRLCLEKLQDFLLLGFRRYHLRVIGPQPLRAASLGMGERAGRRLATSIRQSR